MGLLSLFVREPNVVRRGIMLECCGPRDHERMQGVFLGEVCITIRPNIWVKLHVGKVKPKFDNFFTLVKQFYLTLSALWYLKFLDLVCFPRPPKHNFIWMSKVGLGQVL